MLGMLKSFLRLPVVVGSLPYNILDGQLIDAVPVMGNFNWIVSQINANIPPLIPTISGSIVYVPVASVGGGPNAITLAPAIAISAYAAGQSFRFPATGVNTGAVTISVSGLPNRALQTASGGALTGRELVVGGIYDIVDNGSAYELMNSSQGTGVIAWTPGLSFGGASVGITYGATQGQYIKINNLFYFAFYINLTNKGVSAGQAAITGLPLPPSTAILPAIGVVPMGALVTSNVANPVPAPASLVLQANNGALTMSIYATSSNSANAGQPIANTEFTNASGLRGSGFYVV